MTFPLGDHPKTLANRSRPSAATLCQRLERMAGFAPQSLKVRRTTRRSTWPAARGRGFGSEEKGGEMRRTEEVNEGTGGQDKRVDIRFFASRWNAECFG